MTRPSRAGDAFAEPIGFLTGSVAANAVFEGWAVPLAGGPLAFTRALLHERSGECAAVAPDSLDGALLARLSEPREAFAGLSMDRPRIMGIVNVTPDSFSDGGRAFAVDDALARGRALAVAGADIIDIGGESTRPGAEPVPIEEELGRVLPVVRELAAEGILVSIDTRRARVMTAALAAGARIINDVSALAGDPDALAVAAESGAPVILMHMRGDPRTMQDAPRYEHVAIEVFEFLAARVAACEAAGIPRARVAVDPGIGFGKSWEHNVTLLARLGMLHALGCPVLLGASRKGFIARLARGESADERLAGSLAAALSAVARGVQMVRVHDVAETRQAIDVWRGLAAA